MSAVHVTFENLTGPAILQHLDEVARLRMSVFSEYPYRYSGDVSYERDYLKPLATSTHAVVVLARSGGRIIGASTAYPLTEAAPELQKPFAENGTDLSTVFYFGESVVEPQFRGAGIGKEFFMRRIGHSAQSEQFETYTFCAIERPNGSPPAPDDYRSPVLLWQRMGFERQPQLQANLAWREHGDSEPKVHTMTFWTTRSQAFNRKQVQRYYAAFNAGDHEGMLELLSEDVAHDINEGDRESGKHAFRRFLQRMTACYAEKLTDFEFFCGMTPGRIAAEFTVNGTYLQTDPDAGPRFPAARNQTYELPCRAFF